MKKFYENPYLSYYVNYRKSHSNNDDDWDAEGGYSEMSYERGAEESDEDYGGRMEDLEDYVGYLNN